MSLLAKHLRRSILRAPWQPILILLTVLLTVTLAETALCICGAFAAHEQREASAVAAVGDLEISARADSPSRFLFEEQAARVLGEDGTVLGELALTGFWEKGNENQALSIAAVDLEAADDFYDLSYLAYGRIDALNVDRAAVISAELAEGLGIRIGDQLTVRMLNREFVYEVQAIAAAEGLLMQRDVLVARTGVIRAMAEKMPVISTFGDAFAPCTRLLIRLREPAKAEDISARFFAHEAFERSYVTVHGEDSQYAFFAVIQITFVGVFLLLLLLLSAFLISTSLTILHRQRAADYRLFANVGATPRQLRALLYGESLCYAVIGGTLGVLLAIPTTAAAGGLYHWQQETLRPGAVQGAIGLLVAPILMTVCTAIYLHRHPLNGAKDASKKVVRRGALAEWLIPTALLVASAVLLLSLPVEYRAWAAILGVIAAMLLLYSAFPRLLCLGARLIERLLYRAHPRGVLFVVSKTLRRSGGIHRVGQLLASFLALLLTLTVCEQAFARQAKTLATEIPADLFAAHASVQLEADLRADADVSQCIRLAYVSDIVLPRDTTAVAISFSGDHAAWSDAGLFPERMPVGREVILSKGLAAKCEKQIGDTIMLEQGGRSYEFVVADVMAINTNFLYFDSMELGIARDILCVKLSDGADQRAAEERITALLESNGAMMIGAEAAFGNLPATFEGHLQLMRYAMLFAVVLGALGCGNLLVQQYDGRDKERTALRACGMAKKQQLTMTFFECLLVVVMSALAALIVGGGICLMIDAGMKSFGLALIL